MLLSVGAGEERPPAAHAAFSPELAQLLAEAVERVGAEASPSSAPPSDDEPLEASADLLAMLDEPLDPYEEGSEGGTGTGHRSGTSATAARDEPLTPLPSRVDREQPQEHEEARAPTSLEAIPPPPPSNDALRLMSLNTPPPMTDAQTRPPVSLEEPVPSSVSALPEVLGEGDAALALAQAIATRRSGSLALTAPGGLRRIVLQDGDIVTAGSSSTDETLLAFLVGHGDVDRQSADKLVGKLPPFGRHAGAALVAHGHLGQEDLWPVLRGHAEWVIARAVAEPSGTCTLEPEPPGRLRAEPSVFGGAPGAEVLVEVLRRTVDPETALARLGGMRARLDHGPRSSLLGECALGDHVTDRVARAVGLTVAEASADAEPDLITTFYALAALGVLHVIAPARPASEPARREVDPIDEEGIRLRVRARMALVEEGDYFALLGVSRSATSYEIRRAFLELRRVFEPARLLTAATADLAPDTRLIAEVLDEAYEILREPARRDRYRRAIEASPP